MEGPMYSGGLGMLNQTWVAYGGTQFASNAGEASETDQIIVAMRIQPDAPDQDGVCSSW